MKFVYGGVEPLWEKEKMLVTSDFSFSHYVFQMLVGCIGVQCHFTSEGHIMAYVFPGFLTPVLTQLFFPKPPTTFLTCMLLQK